MDPNCWSNGYYTKERINERAPYIFVKWPCANKRNIPVSTTSLGRMIVHKRKNK